jgi:adenylate cyclase
VPGLLAKPAHADRLARAILGALPGVRHQAEPHESQYLHALRDGVLEDHEGARDHDRRHHHVRRPARLHNLTQIVRQEALSSLLDAFYDDCAAAIWHHDGLLNKTIGDAVLAIFNFPVKQPDHASQALLAARAIQQRFAERRDALQEEIGTRDVELGIGIGIDSGDTNFGEFGRSHRDLTAIGTVVNRAARAQAAAKPGEILVTKTVRDRSGGLVGGEGRDFSLKGFDQPVTLFAA